MRGNFSTGVILSLRDRAGNRCSNPECRRPTSGPAAEGTEKTTNIGWASHICAASPGGPRYDPNQDDEVRHSVENGIWLCAVCAALIDKNEGVGYSVILLSQWKKTAERRAREEIENFRSLPVTVMPSIQALSYVNLPRLVGIAGRRGISIELPALSSNQWLHDLGFETGKVMLSAEALLGAIELEAAPLSVVTDSREDLSGLFVSFSERFFTKNGPRIEDSRTKVYPFDNWSAAPHLHKKIGKRKLVLIYEPRWITTTTAFCEFSSGQTKFAGLAVLKRANPEDTVVIASPLVLGWPKPQFDIFGESGR